MFLFAVAPGAAGRGGRCLPAGAEGMDRYHSPSNIGREEPRSRSSPQFVADSLLERAGFEPSVPGESDLGFAPEGPNVGIQLSSGEPGEVPFHGQVTSR